MSRLIPNKFEFMNVLFKFPKTCMMCTITNDIEYLDLRALEQRGSGYQYPWVSVNRLHVYWSLVKCMPVMPVKASSTTYSPATLDKWNYNNQYSIRQKKKFTWQDPSITWQSYNNYLLTFAAKWKMATLSSIRLYRGNYRN